MAEKKSFNFHIGGYTARLNVDINDEKTYRDAKKAIEQLYEGTHQLYRQKSSEELWMLTAFQVAAILYKTKNPLEQKIEDLTNDIKILLEKE